MEFRTANPASFKVLERTVANRPPRERIRLEVFDYIRAEHIKRIFQDSSLEILMRALPLSLSLSLFFSLAFPLTRFETSWEDKLINYESYFPIQ